jgi:hypothetical protein
VHDFQDGPFLFAPKEYLIVTPVEHITIQANLVGSVLPASTLIEQCFILTAGKIDPGYGRIGDRQQDFVMGLANLLDEPNWFHPDRGIANISFVDFRGSPVLPTQWTVYERRSFRNRERLLRAADDGPFYEEDSWSEEG